MQFCCTGLARDRRILESLGTAGIWAVGEPVEDFRYRVMKANGIATSDLQPSDVDDKLVWSGTLWWNSVGDDGRGHADLEGKDELAVRVGTSYTFAQESGRDESDEPKGESRFFRLSDGTRLIALGVDGHDVRVLAVDAARKLAGFQTS
ncbi:MAG: hypothetical protein IPM29_27095 [Planctomycetes bacterium]|nr:hypothetical protein [Planctomycetota bacterium]